jgi:hypothetical protein
MYVKRLTRLIQLLPMLSFAPNEEHRRQVSGVRCQCFLTRVNWFLTPDT